MSTGLSKSSKPPALFTVKSSGNGATGQISYTTAVARQWKLKELAIYRSTTGALTVNVYLYDTVTAVSYLLITVSGATTGTVRVAPTLGTGEYFIDSDAEIKVTTTGLGGTEAWNLRLTGSLVA